MGNPAEVKGDFRGLEKHRFRAVKLLQPGDLHHSEVGRRLRVCRKTVSRWMEEFHTSGEGAVRRAGRGRKLESSEADRQRRPGYEAVPTFVTTAENS